METSIQIMQLTPEIINAWHAPSCQRPLTVNKNVKTLILAMGSSHIDMPGTVILGVWEGRTYLVDGQHRCYAFSQTGRPTIEALVEIQRYPNGPSGEAAMSAEYIRRNKQLVRRDADDTLRAMEMLAPMLHVIRERCPFVAYSRIRATNGPSRRLISMSNFLRYWKAGGNEAPATFATAEQIARELTPNQVDEMTVFLKLCAAAWGHEKENDTMWCQLNMTITIWLYRHVVLDGGSAVARITRLSPETFQRCLVEAATDTDYRLWLDVVKRKGFTATRSACLRRLREIFAKIVCLGTGMKRSSVRLPQPDWMAS